MQILSRYDNSCLWEGDAATMREAVEKAVKDGANLTGANLTGANLTRANLYGANLTGASLYGANLYGANLAKILNIGPIGSRGACLTIWSMEDGSRRYSTGCQVQIEEAEFLRRVLSTHGDNAHGRAYRAAVEFAKMLT